MISNLDVFLWNRKVGSLVAYKERYTEKICFLCRMSKRYAFCAGCQGDDKGVLNKRGAK